MIKIFDCSINNEYKHRKGSLGPKENDIMMDLKKYVSLYDCIFVKSLDECDVIITNTVFPTDVWQHSIEFCKPKVKRMDGIFWQNDLKHKNNDLNFSAAIADKIIFISEFSKKSFHTLYPDFHFFNKEVAVLNNVDDKIFNNKRNVDELIWCASATNWERKEKRFTDLLKFAQICEEDIYLIGKCDYEVPKNVIKVGYFDNYELMSNVMNDCSAFVNLSYRDAGCKVVTQALNCGLPVLYANSGGVPELVGENGVSIKDNQTIQFDDSVFQLDSEEIKKSYTLFKENFVSLKDSIKIRVYQDTIKSYFDVIKNVWL